MNVIKFMLNWNNKLDCDYYTTIRPDWSYYQKGEVYGILLKGKFLHKAEILEIRKFYLADINQYISFLDAGLSPEELRQSIQKMYPQKDFKVEKLCLLLLKKLKD